LRLRGQCSRSQREQMWSESFVENAPFRRLHAGGWFAVRGHLFQFIIPITVTLSTFVIQGKPILDVARQMASEANYCPATGLHVIPSDEDRSSISSPGYLAITCCSLILAKCITDPAFQQPSLNPSCLCIIFLVWFKVHILQIQTDVVFLCRLS